MTYRRFAAYNVVGGVAWVLSMTLTGYFLGLSIPNVDRHIHIIVAVVIFLSLLPGLIAYLRTRLQSRNAAPIPS
jgi:membrane-associated protein